MTCEALKLPTGETAIVCGPRQRPKKCACGWNAIRLCDHQLKSGRTCDRAICARHCWTDGKRDFCEEHRHAQESFAL